MKSTARRRYHPTPFTPASFGLHGSKSISTMSASASNISERLSKAVQMCTFIGFASATGCLEMNPATDAKMSDLSGFESLNVLMIVSRALFALQYIAAFVLVGRKHMW